MGENEVRKCVLPFRGRELAGFAMGAAAALVVTFWTFMKITDWAIDFYDKHKKSPKKE